MDGLDLTVYWFPNTTDGFLLPNAEFFLGGIAGQEGIHTARYHALVNALPDDYSYLYVLAYDNAATPNLLEEIEVTAYDGVIGTYSAPASQNTTTLGPVTTCGVNSAEFGCPSGG